MTAITHQAVLLKEAIDSLAIDASSTYIDGTFGRGGHSQAILACLNKQGRLWAFDKDDTPIQYAKENFGHDARFHIVKNSFAHLVEICEHQSLVGQVAGVLLDVGVSSPQLDDAMRGFSFMQDGPLDMRMDTSQVLSAQTFIEQASVAEMVQIFREYGEERYAYRIALAIADFRQHTPITTTGMLAQIIKLAHPRWEKHKHPATRVFQAIRIHINEELAALQAGLKAALHVLKPGGRLVVISFHSLEDRIVKQFMRSEAKALDLPKYIPVKSTDMPPPSLRIIGKAIKASARELAGNIRARSAVMRVGEKHR
ncbi:MAG TPA: 16S rRNA (cytosine(1402)-N(4))-methyltransferase [Legionellales bacterium]|nr:16S rRNA (cytosine(1402)-N(4))-methyltransferase [Legionellales bacterium]